MGRHRMLSRWKNGIKGTLQNCSVTSGYGEPMIQVQPKYQRCHGSGRDDCLLKTQDSAKCENDVGRCLRGRRLLPPLIGRGVARCFDDGHRRRARLWPTSLPTVAPRHRDTGRGVERAHCTPLEGGAAGNAELSYDRSCAKMRYWV